MATVEDLTNKIKRSLGDGKVTIELTDMQIEDSIDQALDIYNQYLSYIFYQQMPVNSGQSVYDIAPFVASIKLTNIIAVQSVPKGQQVNIYNGMYEGTGLPFVNFTDQGLSFYQYREQLQNIEYLFDSITDFLYDPYTEKLQLKVPIAVNTVTLVCTRPLTADQIRPEHTQLFFKGCLSYAKETLGLIRRKFKGAELPGGTVELDGSELVSEAKEEQEKYLIALTGQQKDAILIG